MKCLLKTIIAIVLIVVIGGLLLWFVGFPALLAEDKVVKNLEKQDYEVQTSNSDDPFGAVGLFMPEGATAVVAAHKGDYGEDDYDSITIYYFDESKDAKEAKDDIEKAFDESLDAILEGIGGGEAEGMFAGVANEIAASIEQVREDTKFVRFGKIVVTGSVRGIIAAMIGL